LRIRHIAEKQAEALDPVIQPLFAAYALGISTYIERGSMPLEIDLLRYSPEPWTIADSISWVKMMAWDLSANWEAELLRAQLVDKLGPEKEAELEPPYAKVQPLIIPEGVDYACIGTEALNKAANARMFTGPAPQDGLGSNNWVLSGKRTVTGMPLLANDMHLGMTIPAIWFQNHLVAGEMNVSGISFPGIPFVIAGHNQHVAWSFTNGFTDVQDLFIERLDRKEDGRVLYEFQGGWRQSEVYQETIAVKGGPPVTEEVIVTHHGPIINNLAPDLSKESPLALRWTALELDDITLAIYQMNLADCCHAFQEALRHWSVPSQNTVYADTNGDIGYSLPGKLPVRAKGNGRVPVPGWTGEYEWIGYVPFEELPHMFNPPLGYIATANNKVINEDYPHWIGYDYIAGNRAQRIVEMIEDKQVLGIGDIQTMHRDLVSPAARRVRDALQGLETSDPELKQALERLQRWDGTLTVNSPEAGLYQVFIRRLIPYLLKDFLEELTIHYAGKGPTPVLKEGTIFGQRSREWLLAVLEDPDPPWFDHGDGLNRQDHLLVVLQESLDELKQLHGPDFKDWAWGKLHTLTFNHPLGSVKPLDTFFNRGPYPIGGDGDTIWATGTSAYDLNNDSMVGPPFRFIADLSDWNQSQGMLVPGQSGHPASLSYDNNIQPWFRGEYHPMVFDREAVMQALKSVMKLEPK
jgi:penicillin amidase